MDLIVYVVHAGLRVVRRIITLVREGEDDLRGTYPHAPSASPEQVAVTASINIAALSGFGS